MTLITVFTLALATAAAPPPEPISLELVRADSGDVFLYMAQVGQTPVVIHPEAQQPITARFIDLPWREALDRLTNLNGLAVVELDGAHWIVPVTEVTDVTGEVLGSTDGERLATLLLPVQQADLEDLAERLRREVLSPAGSAVSRSGLEMLVVQEVMERERIASLVAFVKAADRP